MEISSLKLSGNSRILQASFHGYIKIQLLQIVFYIQILVSVISPFEYDTVKMHLLQPNVLLRIENTKGNTYLFAIQICVEPCNLSEIVMAQYPDIVW